MMHAMHTILSSLFLLLLSLLLLLLLNMSSCVSLVCVLATEHLLNIYCMSYTVYRIRITFTLGMYVFFFFFWPMENVPTASTQISIRVRPVFNMVYVYFQCVDA